jgi:F420-dependent methylenetetrahydromethanopterin dehydrogenase
MKPSALLAFALILAACGTARPVLESDSTRVEVKTVVEKIIDTAYVELPVIVEKVATLDTASILENKYAKSEAIVSGGVLTIHWPLSPSDSL